MTKRFGRSQPLAALRERQFRLLFTAQTVSALGDQTIPVVLAFAVLDITNSAADLGLVLAARLVPMIVIMPASGIWADRFSRRTLLIGSNVVRMVSQGVIGVLIVAGSARIWEIALSQAVLGAATAFSRPAFRGLVAEIVAVQHRQRANALLTGVSGIAAFLGPAVAGLLVVGIGPGWGVVGDAVTFALAALLIVRMQVPPLEATIPERFLKELADGWKEVARRRWVWLGILNSSIAQLIWLSALSVLGPVVAQRSLGGPSAWAVISAAFGAGAFLGTWLALYVRPKRPLAVAYVMTTGCAFTLFLLGASAPVWAIAVAELYSGAAVGIISVLWETTLQNHIPLTSYGRVAAYDLTGSLLLRPLGLALVGPIAQWIGVTPTLVGAGVITALSSALLLLVPEIRGMTAEQSTPAAPAREKAAAEGPP